MNDGRTLRSVNHGLGILFGEGRCPAVNAHEPVVFYEISPFIEKIVGDGRRGHIFKLDHGERKVEIGMV